MFNFNLMGIFVRVSELLGAVNTAALTNTAFSLFFFFCLHYAKLQYMYSSSASTADTADLAGQPGSETTTAVLPFSLQSSVGVNSASRQRLMGEGNRAGQLSV